MDEEAADMARRQSSVSRCGELAVEMVICTHQRAYLLGRLLESVLKNRIPEGLRLEILVVANGCTDDTADVVQEAAVRLLEHQVGVRYLEEPVLGKSHALNRALEYAGGEYLLFTDDDHRLDSGFFTALHAGMQAAPGENLYCGRVLPDWSGREPAWLRETGEYAIRPPPVPCQDWGDAPRWLDGRGRVPGGGNLIVKREFALSLGPFATDLGPHGHDLYGGEDGEWLSRALRRGERIRYLPDVIQYHYVDPERLRLRYLVTKAFVRSRNSTGMQFDGDRVPRYQYRKIAGHLLHVLMTPRLGRKRYHLVRLAASLGEYAGMRDRIRGA